MLFERNLACNLVFPRIVGHVSTVKIVAKSDNLVNIPNSPTFHEYPSLVEIVFQFTQNMCIYIYIFFFYISLFHYFNFLPEQEHV